MSLMPDMVSSFRGYDATIRMLTYSIRCPEVAALALAKLNPEDFSGPADLEFQVIWAAAKAHWEAVRSAPTAQYMHDICVSIMIAQGFPEQTAQARIHKCINDIYALDENPWNDAYGKELLRSFLARMLTEAIRHIVTTNPDDASKVVDLIGSEYQRRSVDDATEIDPFDLKANSMMGANRRYLGVQPLDYLLGGGIADTECIGILGPSGGGKTLMAIQVAGSLALRKEHVLYFTYEQPAEELRPRLISFMTKLPKDAFEKKRPDEMKDPVRIALEKLSEYKSYVKIIDRSSGGDSLIEIDNRIKKAISINEKPRLIIIDWIWILITRMAAASNRKNVQERQHLMAAMDGFKSMASKYGVPFMILQQLSTEQAKKSPSKKPQWFNSAEAGNFAWLLAYCFAIGKADENGYCYLVGSKARNAKTNTVIMQLKGDVNRFDPAEKAMFYKPGSGFLDVKKANSFDDPSESDKQETPEVNDMKAKYDGAEGVA